MLFPEIGPCLHWHAPGEEEHRQGSRAISALTNRSRLPIHPAVEVAELNRLLTGWANYFCLGPVSKAYRGIDAHVRMRLRRWLCKRHKTPGRGIARFPDEHLYQKLGLKRLQLTTRNLPWAKA